MWVRIPPGALAIVLAVLAACSSGTDDAPTATTSRADAERRDARAWSDRAAAAYQPLQLTARDLPVRVRAWLEGERSTEELQADLAVAEGEVADVRTRVAALPAFERDEQVAPLYRWSSLLYVEYVAVLRAATAHPPGPMREQVELIARRVRILGDRVFDRGQARLDRLLHEPPNPDVVIQLPPEVPDWVADGQAAGPPLDDPPPPADATPALRQDERPTQARAAWVAAVRSADIPSATEVDLAISAADPVRQREVAGRLEAVTRSLDRVADPAGAHGREEAAQARLALLVYAEAARVASAGLPDIGRRLVEIADGVWDAVPGLPDRP